MIYFEDNCADLNEKYEQLNNYNYDDGIKNLDSS
jgi:hypothetical protein